ncbi:hypothetical protein ACIOG8_37515 [Streptomyces erythrochromogenes]|uniref:hypothetical protein n=1 Tax=Streptomyces erythrochromogenes TaxID=285574 RepID=UPI00381E59E7
MNRIEHYSRGDLLSISCEAVEARVARVTQHYILVEWPWGEPDVGKSIQWDGTMGFPRSPSSPDWLNTPWRLEPESSELSAGDMCFVGIPCTVVAIQGVNHFDPPLVTGLLPRPTVGLDVVDNNHFEDDEAGFRLYLDGPEPIEVERVSNE